MTVKLPVLKKRKLIKRRGGHKNIKKENMLYLAYYDIQNFSMELTHPVMTFKTHKAAEIYVQNRNFEFQLLMMASRNAQQSSILDSLKNAFNDDYCITVSDLKLAGEYMEEEYNRLIKDNSTEEDKEKLYWYIMHKYINPFRITTIEYISQDYR